MGLKQVKMPNLNGHRRDVTPLVVADPLSFPTLTPCCCYFSLPFPPAPPLLGLESLTCFTGLRTRRSISKFERCPPHTAVRSRRRGSRTLSHVSVWRPPLPRRPRLRLRQLCHNRRCTLDRTHQRAQCHLIGPWGLGLWPRRKSAALRTRSPLTTTVIKRSWEATTKGSSWTQKNSDTP